MADVLERDAGFCSGGEEYDMEAEDGIRSPTDASEDSVDVKVQAISLRNRNKRKCAEPRKLDTELPAKKRKISLSVGKEVEQASRSPFRPWSASPPAHKDESLVLCSVTNRIAMPPSPQAVESPLDCGRPDFGAISIPMLPSFPSARHPLLGVTHPQDPANSYPLHLPTSFSPRQQEEPLSLVSKRKDRELGNSPTEFGPAAASAGGKAFLGGDGTSPPGYKTFPRFADSDTRPIGRANDRKGHAAAKVKFSASDKTNGDKKLKLEPKTKPEDVSHQCDNKFRIDTLLSSAKTEGSSGASTSKSSQGGQQRNYKNMTRERRIEANARERTRVHTISAAFDTLRHSIPAYSHNQKLSKLSVLRIACSYIMTLSRLAGYDYSKDQSEPDLSNCVENVSRTIQTEGKIRKKKED